jgi:hypothetical protein
MQTNHVWRVCLGCSALLADLVMTCLTDLAEKDIILFQDSRIKPKLGASLLTRHCTSSKDAQASGVIISRARLTRGFRFLFNNRHQSGHGLTHSQNSSHCPFTRRPFAFCVGFGPRVRGLTHTPPLIVGTDNSTCAPTTHVHPARNDREPHRNLASKWETRVSSMLPTKSTHRDLPLVPTKQSKRLETKCPRCFNCICQMRTLRVGTPGLHSWWVFRRTSICKVLSHQ